MEILWFCNVSFMIAMYVVLDGFDLGAGIIHLFIARSDAERRTVLNAIGPVWDGNEVWLVAGGGTLYFAFPLVYASSFSGFYLPLMIVLWLLILRAIGIEFRHQLHHPLWKTFWDTVFALGSILLAVFFGAALGNVVRGVPLRNDGYFFLPLWTSFNVEPNPGILDWFTVLMGVVSLATLTVHGSNYIALKTEGELRQRAHKWASAAWWGVLLTSVAAVIAVTSIRPQVWNNYSSQPWGYVLPFLGILGLAGMKHANAIGNDRYAFRASSMFIIGMLASTAFGLFPNLLPSCSGSGQSLTAYNTIAGEYGLQVGIVWWVIGILLAAVYFIYIYRTSRGKVKIPVEGEGY
jgi:cytochrome d ubiquinol oxidase subunit II